MLDCVSMDACCDAKEQELRILRTNHNKILTTVLLVNAVLFVIEAAAGLLANSTALLADSLDMLGNSLVYGFSLYVLWRRTAGYHVDIPRSRRNEDHRANKSARWSLLQCLVDPRDIWPWERLDEDVWK
jgi:hypothetical protein